MTSPARTLRLLPPLPWTELAQRRARGRALRKRLPRLDQGKWEPDRRRHDPLAILARAERGHLPALLPIKHGRMAVSPFTFFRGAVPVMAADLGTLPMTGLAVQICGDAHVRNLGAFAAPDGHLVFDINDFDETTRAPWEWDLKRLATSSVLAGRAESVPDRLVPRGAGAGGTRPRLPRRGRRAGMVLQLGIASVRRDAAPGAASIRDSPPYRERSRARRAAQGRAGYAAGRAREADGPGSRRRATLCVASAGAGPRVLVDRASGAAWAGTLPHVAQPRATT